MNSVNAWTAHWAKQNSLKSFYLPEIQSTNSWAKAEFRWAHQVALFSADHQTQGRGRGQNAWTNSQPGSTWMCTWCFALKSVPHPLLNMRIGLALYQALNTTWNLTALGLKAPNDIYIGDGKLAGILTEVVSGSEASLFVGIGMNVFRKPSLGEQKTQSLNDHCAVDNSTWEKFCAILASALRTLVDTAPVANLSESECENVLIALKNFNLNTVNDLLPDGTLVLQNGNRVHWNEL